MNCCRERRNAISATVRSPPLGARPSSETGSFPLNPAKSSRPAFSISLVALMTIRPFDSTSDSNALYLAESSSSNLSMTVFHRSKRALSSLRTSDLFCSTT